ncbi:MAG: hypothetical protein ABIR96_12025, partial [Bdellovibrionota bacterium]
MISRLSFAFVTLLSVPTIAQEVRPTLDHHSGATAKPAEVYAPAAVANLEQCPSGPDMEMQRALKYLDSSNVYLQDYLSRPTQQQRDTYAQRGLLQSASRKVLDYLKTHDPATCLPGGWEQYHFICAVAPNLNTASIQDGTLIIDDPDARVSYRRAIVGPNALAAAWKVIPGGATSSVANINVGSAKAQKLNLLTDVSIDRWSTDAQSQDYYGHSVADTSAAVKVMHVSKKEMGLDAARGCEQLRPADVYKRAMAVASGHGFDIAKENFDKVSSDLANTAASEGLEHGMLNVGDALKSVPEGLKGTYGILANSEMESSDPKAYPCMDKKLAGKKCERIRDKIFEIYGPKLKAAHASCVKDYCLACSKTGGVPLLLTDLNAVNACLGAKAAAALGTAAWNGIKKCASNTDEASRCLAGIAVVTGTAAVTGGISMGTTSASLKLGASIGNLAQAGKITAETANVLLKVTRSSAALTAGVADLSLNQLPLNPAEWSKLSLKELKLVQSDLAKVAAGMTNDAKGAAEIARLQKT